MKKLIVIMITTLILSSAIGLLYSLKSGGDIEQDAGILNNVKIDLTKKAIYKFSFVKHTLVGTGFYIRTNLPGLYLDPSDPGVQYVEKNEQERKSKKYYEDRIKKIEDQKEIQSTNNIIEKLNYSIGEYEKNNNQQIINIRQIYNRRYEKLNELKSYFSENLRLRIVLTNINGRKIFERIVPSKKTDETHGYIDRPYAPRIPPSGIGIAYVDLLLGWLYPDRLQEYTLQVEVLSPLLIMEPKTTYLLAHYAPKELWLMREVIYFISIAGLLLGICGLLLFWGLTFIAAKRKDGQVSE